MAKSTPKELIRENDRLFAKNQQLKRLLTDALYIAAAYQGSLEARKKNLEVYPDLKHLSDAIDPDIRRVISFSINAKDAIFDK